MIGFEMGGGGKAASCPYWTKRSASFNNCQPYETTEQRAPRELRSPHSRRGPDPFASPKLRQGISRRAISASLVGLTGLVTVVGSGTVWWMHAHPPEGQKAKIGTTLVIYRGHERKIRALAWSPDGTRIASASADNTVQVWDAATGNNPISYDGHSSSVEG